MWEILDHLRSKPRAARQRIAIVVSGALSILVFMGWWGGLTANDHVNPVADVGQKSPVAVVGETIKNFTTRSHSLWQDSMTQMKYDAQAELAGTAAADADLNPVDSDAIPLTPTTAEKDEALPLQQEATVPDETAKPDGVFPEGTESSFEAATQVSTSTN